MDATQKLLAIMATVKSFEQVNDSDGLSSPSSPESPTESPNVISSVQASTIADIIGHYVNGNSIKDVVNSSQKSASQPRTAREPRIKRPMNAFMVWSQQRRQQIAATGQKFHNSDISKMLGAEWRKMEEHEKVPFVERAKQLREEHFNAHPDYVYRPRRRKRVEKSAGSVDSNSADEITKPVNVYNSSTYTNVFSQLFFKLLCDTHNKNQESQGFKITNNDQVIM
ncbi:Sex-determining region Y protein [Caenorhabditis elegans]|nr:HMG box domain-containing protein [Caenorhabditis elegans]CCD64312.1 HMG box domain-containing protein [Caenorhabditis elegans]|eukprot:NP_508604.3 SOX (mammalian SRY box) family [Caenorhabditis elegans]